MRKVLFFALFMLACVPAAFAQSTTDERKGPEFFVGYTNMQAEGVPSQEKNTNNSFDDKVFGDRTGLHGFNAEITGYVTPRFGLTGDFSFNQRSRSFNNGAGVEGDVDTRIVNVLGGPQVKFPNQTRVTPFIRALFGVANTRFEAQERRTLTTGTVSNSFTTNATDFAMAMGGGLDVRLNDRVQLRVLQVDYNPVFLRNRSISVLGGAGALTPQTLESNRQDNIRLSFGVVFK
ncbi:MAG TPA: outer membrane beta-barrel protein [Pyrinomonadaceae bacterium]|jgi:opacity protein-like surface antigen